MHRGKGGGGNCCPPTCLMVNYAPFGNVECEIISLSNLFETGVNFRYVVDRDNGKAIPHIRVFGHDQIGLFG